MNNKTKIVTLFLLPTALLLAILTVSSATAQEPEGNVINPTGTTNPTTMLYQGYVKIGDEPYDGTGYFKFAVVNATGNSTYWSNDGTSSGGSEPSTSTSQQVNAGYFTILLGDTSLSGMSQALSPSVFAGSGRYLRIWFAQSVSGSFTQLSPVPIAAAPYAMNAETLDGYDSEVFQKRVSGSCSSGNAIRVINTDGTVNCEPVSGGVSHDHWGESWSGSGIGLLLESSSGTALGAHSYGTSPVVTTIYGENHGSGSSAGLGVEGYSAEGIGTVGESITGTGLVGIAGYGSDGFVDTALRDDIVNEQAGVYGHSTDGPGGYFASTYGHGIYGTSYDLDGVRGVSTGGGMADNGVYGETNSSSSGEAGVYGYSSSSATGVIGENTSLSGVGVRGLSANGNESDVHPGGYYYYAGGEFAGRNGIIGSASSDVTDGYGVLGLAQGIYGRGVYGRALITTGPNYGGYFLSESISGTGVYAGGGYADIVLGGDDAGNIRSNPSGIHSDIYLYSNDEVEVHLDDNADSTSSFSIYNDANTQVFNVDESGDMTADGTKSSVVAAGSNGSRKMYAIESPGVWFEDFGTAQLIDGEITVSIDPMFAQTVNLTETYHIYLTPVSGEAVLLFVTNKDISRFTVQGVNLDGQPADASFDYRIVAKRRGYEDVRMEPTSTLEPMEQESVAPTENLPLTQQQGITSTHEQGE